MVEFFPTGLNRVSEHPMEATAFPLIRAIGLQRGLDLPVECNPTA